MRRILILPILLSVTYVMNAQSVPKLLELADQLYQADRYLDAIEFYEKISSIDKENYFARFRLGTCYNSTLQYEKAKEAALKILADDVLPARYRCFIDPKGHIVKIYEKVKPELHAAEVLRDLSKHNK